MGDDVTLHDAFLVGTVVEGMHVTIHGQQRRRARYPIVINGQDAYRPLNGIVLNLAAPDAGPDIVIRSQGVDYNSPHRYLQTLLAADRALLVRHYPNEIRSMSANFASTRSVLFYVAGIPAPPVQWGTIKADTHALMVANQPVPE